MIIVYLVSGFYGSDGCFHSWICKAFIDENDAFNFISELEIQLMLLYEHDIKERRERDWEKKYCEEKYYKYLEPGFGYARNADDISFSVDEIELEG